MQRPTGTTPAMQITIIEDGIHELCWFSEGNDAIDAWFDYNEALYEQTSPDDTIRFLHVAQMAKFPPIAYISRKARNLQSKYAVQPKTRTAVLFKSVFFGGFINTLSGLLNRSGQDVTRFFADDERDKAIAWLIQE